MPRPLIIPRSVLDGLSAHALEALPEECCGVLLGPTRTDPPRVAQMVRAENIAEGDRTTAYQIDWQTLFAVTKATRNSEERIVGFFHSHPDGSRSPSARDLADAWIDFSYVIVSVDALAGTVSRVTSWRIPPGTNRFEEEQIVVP